MRFFTDIWDTLRSFYESRQEPEYMRPLAEWYWRTLLSVALVALFSILAFGVWKFYNVTRILSAGADSRPSRQPEVLSKKDIADILTAFSERQARFEAAKDARTVIPDPSR